MGAAPEVYEISELSCILVHYTLSMKCRSLLPLLVLTHCLFASIRANAQEANSLLWRISGKGLRIPSYLLGTIELTDRRLFQFGDSVYHYIQQSEGFVSSLDMDKLSREMLGSLLSRESAEKKVMLKDMLSPGQQRAYASGLSKQFGKPFREINYNELRSLFENHEYLTRGPDDMSTTMDPWLYEIAKRKGKVLGGLETYEEVTEGYSNNLETMIQFVLKSATEKQKEQDQFIKLYTGGKLQELGELAAKKYPVAFGPGNKRIHRILHKIDSVSSLRSTFYSVGAHLLGGRQGLLQALRVGGYTVEAVAAGKPVAYQLHERKPSDITWYSTAGTDSLFEVQMPGRAVSAPMAVIPAKASIYFDTYTMSAYVTASLAMPGLSRANTDTALDKFAEGFAQHGEVYVDSALSRGRYRGRHLEIEMEQGYNCMQVWCINDQLVFNMFVSTSGKPVRSDLNQYFQSFTINEKKAGLETRGWSVVQTGIGGLVFESPVRMSRETGILDSAWRQTSFYNFDDQGQNYYMAKIIETRQGYYSNTDTGYMVNAVRELENNPKATSIHTRRSVIHGQQAMEVNLVMKEASDSVHVRMIAFNKGNRRFILINSHAQVAGHSHEDADRFFRSVAFEPQEAPIAFLRSEWEGGFRVKAPAPFQQDTTLEVTEKQRYIMYDSVHSITTYVDVDPLYKYYSTDSDSTFLLNHLSMHEQEGDSLLHYTIGVQDSQPYINVLFSMPGTENLKWVKMQPSGDSLYSIYTHIHPEIQRLPLYQEMFTSFGIIGGANPSSYRNSKAGLLFNDLLIPDDLVFEAAKEALGSMNFRQEDIPLLQQAVLHPYQDFDEYRYCTHDMLVEKLVSANHPSTLAFLTGAYTQHKYRNKELQYPLLSGLARMKTREATLAIKQLLQGGLPREGNANILYTPFLDSVELVSLLMPDLLEYAADSIFVTLLPALLPELKDKGFLSEVQFLSVKPAMVQLARKYEQLLASDSTLYPQQFFQLSRLLARYGTADDFQLLHALGRAGNIDVKYTVVTTQLDNNQTADPGWLKLLAGDEYYRIKLYESLEKNKQLKLFPAAYATAKHLGSSRLNSVLDGEAGVFLIEYLSEHKRKSGRKAQLFSLFRVTLGEGEAASQYLGVAGPFDGKDPMKMAGESRVGVYTMEPLDTSDPVRQLEKFLLEWE